MKFPFPARRRRQRILPLAVPIIGGMVSQNIVNLVDTYMVGSLGDAALAAVGMGGFANWLSMAFITGLAVGVQAMASRRLGEGNRDTMALPLNGGLVQAFVLGVPLSMLAIFATPYFFPLLVDDPAVYELGIPYLRIRLLGMVAVAMNFAFRGYWNGVNLSRLYMGTLVVMHVTNVSVSWVLIFGHFGMPELGVRGAAIGSAVAAWVGTGVYFWHGLRNARQAGFLHGIPSMESMLTMFRLSMPSGVQQLFFAGGMTAFLWVIGKVGTASLAASNVMMNLVLVAVLPAVGFGLAAASLVGQALGAAEPKDAERWGWEVAALGAVVVGSLAAPAILVPELFLGLFIREPETVALATTALRIVAMTIAVDAFGVILMNAHFGAGAVAHVTRISIVLQWVLFLPTIFVLVTQFGLGLTAVWGAQVVYRAVQSLVFSISWARGSWKSIRV